MPLWPTHGGGNNSVFIGGSSSGAGGGGGGRGRANSSSRAPGRRWQRANASNRGSARGCGGCGVRAARSAGPPQAIGGDYIDVDEEGAWEEEVEDLGSSDGSPLKNQIGILKSIYSFWGYMQSHTGLGRKPDGSVDADSDYWRPYLEGKPYLKKVLKGPPANLDQLEEMFSGNIVDGSTTFVPGDDYGEGHEGAWAEEAEEDYVQIPRSSSSQKSKRSLGSTTSTCDSPVKKSKSPMVRYVKDISVTFKEAMQVNNKEMLKRAANKEAVSVKRCQQLAFECGIEQTSDAVFAMAKMFEDPFQREFFSGLPSSELRFNYFKRWCREHNLV
ncbi:hypothetical protein C2845_PM11G01800 [Panicum miliaceum]|uniref:Myb/SANT-like domain-containing protein n=1 Tax=Panicum miliaceum TaxID=4540 RepID=A0A3L6RWI4_PANMI|nr:hypothetical protein C2845_PM11G01800 [Panicum miliaceum]